METWKLNNKMLRVQKQELLTEYVRAVLQKTTDTLNMNTSHTYK
jgi:hypothetical protein